MTRFAISFLFLWLGLTSSAHAWFFFFIPGSVVQATGDAISGAKGNMCVKEGLEIGHIFTSPNGNTAKVLSLSGTSSICKNPAQPIRAEIEFTYSFASKAGIELPDDFKPSTLTDFERFNGFLLKATSSSVREYGIQISATKKNPTTSIQLMANNIEQSMLANQRFSESKSLNAETITINGAPSVRFEIAVTMKGMFGSKGSYLYTILEGDDEIVVVNVYAPTEYIEEHRDEMQQYASRVSGIRATVSAIAPLPATEPIAAPSAAEKAPVSSDDRLQQLNKMLKNGLITKDEYNAKRKEILKAL